MNSSVSSPGGLSVSPPGSSFSDKSLELYKDIVSFFRTRQTQHNSPVFNARILMKTTTIVGSNFGVRQILNECAESFHLGYKDYFSHIYGDVVLFAEDICAKDMRGALLPLFHSVSVHAWKGKVLAFSQRYYVNLDISQPVCIYSMFKQLTSELMICFFLDLKPEEDRETIERIIHLSVIHWHGIISVPITWKIPLGFSGGCRKALDAKDELLGIVRERWEKCEDKESFLHHFKQMPFSSRDTALDHLVLLVTALVPKAFSSLLTSCLLSGDEWSGCRGEDGGLEGERMRAVLLEVGRLWPPFVAGRRVAKENTSIDGFTIPAGRPVVFVSHSAHRDPKVFQRPDEFRWERWINQNENQNDEDKVFWLGGGFRSCIGKHLVHCVLQEVLNSFLKKFNWTMIDRDSAKGLHTN